MYDDSFRANYTSPKVSFVHMNASNHPSFVTVPNSLKRSINDQRFFAFEWCLNQTYGNALNPKEKLPQCVLLTDSHDMELLQNPFQYMQTMDDLLGELLLYVGSEDDPKRVIMERVQENWYLCFHEKYPYVSTIHNVGILGGRVSVVGMC